LWRARLTRGVAPVTPGPVDLSGALGQDVGKTSSQSSGKVRRTGGGAPGDAQLAGERDPVGVEVRRVGGAGELIELNSCSPPGSRRFTIGAPTP
jgi:hypothetical protein